MDARIPSISGPGGGTADPRRHLRLLAGTPLAAAFGRAACMFVEPRARRAGRVARKLRRWTAAAASAVVLCALAWGLLWRTGRAGEQRPYDALIIPGGGLDEAGRPSAWVAERLEAALRHDGEADWYLVLSRGTTHRPPPRDAAGYAVDEAAASARYLMDRGVATSRVLLEAWSLDTIGNAAFARLFHAELGGWRSCLVITSALHMPRTRAIFEWVFSLPPRRGRPVKLAYEAVADEAALPPGAADARRRKEADALAEFRQTAAAVGSLAELHAFLFTRHAAYSAAGRASPHTAAEAKGALLGSY